MFKQVTMGAVAVGLLFAAQGALAGHDKPWKHDRYGGRQTQYEYARVLDVEPMMRRVRVTVPRRECYMETRYDYDDRDYGRDDRYYRVGQPRSSAGSMILGGIIGAAVGNQIGSGDGRRAATVAGAIIGSAIGHDTAARRAARDGDRYGDYREHREPRAYEVERCDTRYEEDWEERVDGYLVTYEYNGQRRTTRLPYDPGDRLRVRVDVRPEDDC
jgi:uncharacterized protein YcfJ